jgi:hypothetical protein
VHKPTGKSDLLPVPALFAQYSISPSCGIGCAPGVPRRLQGAVHTVPGSRRWSGFFNHKWFRRVWVTQEMALGPQLTIYIGTCQMTHQDLVRLNSSYFPWKASNRNDLLWLLGGWEVPMQPARRLWNYGAFNHGGQYDYSSLSRWGGTQRWTSIDRPQRLCLRPSRNFLPTATTPTCGQIMPSQIPQRPSSSSMEGRSLPRRMGIFCWRIPDFRTKILAFPRGYRILLPKVLYQFYRFLRGIQHCYGTPVMHSLTSRFPSTAGP